MFKFGHVPRGIPLEGSKPWNSKVSERLVPLPSEKATSSKVSTPFVRKMGTSFEFRVYRLQSGSTLNV